MDGDFKIAQARRMPRRATKLSDDPVARRLALTRMALGYALQEDFARAARIGANVYNPWETGRRRLPMDGARMLCDAHGLTIEWLYDGIPSRLPYELVMKLIDLGAMEPATTEAPPRTEIIRKQRK